MKRLNVRSTVFFLVFFLGVATCFPQYYELTDRKDRSRKIRFELVNNLMVLPLEVNGTPLNFILDSGVSKPILFSLAKQDSIGLKNVSKITIRGLGSGEPIEALRSAGNTFKLGGLKNINQDLYVVLDRDINLSPTLGIQVHGIIGHDLFRDYVVEVNYSRKFLRFHDPDTYSPGNPKNAIRLPLEVEDQKAYLHGNVVVEGQQEVPVKLLMDTGSTDALWLFPAPEKGLPVPKKHYEEFLGKGLSGAIYGKRTRIKSLRFGDFVIEGSKAAFPHMDSFRLAGDLGDRNGSAGGDLLKRFNMVVNYPKGWISLKKNTRFDEPFQFNHAGIELEHSGVRFIAERIADANNIVRNDSDTFGNVHILLGNQTRLSLVPEIVVSAIRAGSPAEEVGLREGDVILAVNGRPVDRYKLQEVLQMINERKGRRVRLLIERYNQDLLFSFVIRELFE